MTPLGPAGISATEHADQLIARGHTLEDGGDFEAARRCYDEAVAAAPRHPRAHMNLGNALRGLNRPSEAAAAFHAALGIAPDFVPARFNLGSLLASLGDFGAAEVELREVLRRQPDLAEAMVALADVLDSTERLDEAERLLRRALDVQPDMAGAAFNLGHLLARANRFEDAERWIMRAKALDPSTYRDALSSYFAQLMLRGDIDPGTIFSAHRRIGAAIAAQAGAAPAPHPNVREPERPLRIGYVSGDFRQHPIGLFMRPVLAAHDSQRFDVHCYACNDKSDPATDVLRGLARHWHDVGALSDAELSDLIRAHRIDVLVDLAGHTDNSRLGAFARRPAPVQVSWMGYLNTTGLPAMDYRICDGHAERPGIADALHTEQLYRVPHSQWCYAPWYDVPLVEIPHADRPTALVFGSFNQAQKIGDTALELWCRVLRALPAAELHLLDFSDERQRRSMRDRLARRGIAEARVKLRERVDILEYFRSIGNVDIALDTVPYNGATTTLDTLWMGTPLVALAGDRGVARGSYSIMRSLGSSELIATTLEDYVDLNIRLARDAEWRRTLRRDLRPRMAASPLMDVAAFVGALERAYREMWLTWCASLPHE